MCFKRLYAGILVNRIRRVTEEFIDDEQKGFRAWRRCVDQRKHEKKRRVFVGFMDLEMAYDMFIMNHYERMYGVVESCCMEL